MASFDSKKSNDSKKLKSRAFSMENFLKGVRKTPLIGGKTPNLPPTPNLDNKQNPFDLDEDLKPRPKGFTMSFGKEKSPVLDSFSSALAFNIEKSHVEIAQGGRPAGESWHDPNVDQMVESLITNMMTRGNFETIPVEYNSSVLCILESYSMQKTALKKKNEEMDKLERELRHYMLAIAELKERHLSREADYKTEIKKLEVIVANGPSGFEAVSLARSNSVLNRQNQRPTRPARFEEKSLQVPLSREGSGNNPLTRAGSSSSGHQIRRTVSNSSEDAEVKLSKMFRQKSSRSRRNVTPLAERSKSDLVRQRIELQDPGPVAQRAPEQDIVEVDESSVSDNRGIESSSLAPNAASRIESRHLSSYFAHRAASRNEVNPISSSFTPRGASGNERQSRSSSFTPRAASGNEVNPISSSFTPRGAAGNESQPVSSSFAPSVASRNEVNPISSSFTPRGASGNERQSRSSSFTPRAASGNEVNPIPSSSRPRAASGNQIQSLSSSFAPSVASRNEINSMSSSFVPSVASRDESKPLPELPLNESSESDDTASVSTVKQADYEPRIAASNSRAPSFDSTRNPNELRRTQSIRRAPSFDSARNPNELRRTPSIRPAGDYSAWRSRARGASGAEMSAPNVSSMGFSTNTDVGDGSMSRTPGAAPTMQLASSVQRRQLAEHFEGIEAANLSREDSSSSRVTAIRHSSARNSVDSNSGRTSVAVIAAARSMAMAPRDVNEPTKSPADRRKSHMNEEM